MGNEIHAHVPPQVVTCEVHLEESDSPQTVSKPLEKQPEPVEISKVTFKIKYETLPGQDLYILGESEKFGNWGSGKMEDDMEVVKGGR